MIYVYMTKMLVIMQFWLSFLMSEIMGDEFECDQVSLDHESLNPSLLVLFVVILV